MVLSRELNVRPIGAWEEAPEEVSVKKVGGLEALATNGERLRTLDKEFLCNVSHFFKHNIIFIYPTSNMSNVEGFVGLYLLLFLLVLTPDT